MFIQTLALSELTLFIQTLALSELTMFIQTLALTKRTIVRSVYVPMAQLDRVLGYEPSGWGFESLWVYKKKRPCIARSLLFIVRRTVRLYKVIRCLRIMMLGTRRKI